MISKNIRLVDVLGAGSRDYGRQIDRKMEGVLKGHLARQRSNAGYLLPTPAAGTYYTFRTYYWNANLEMAEKPWPTETMYLHRLAVTTNELTALCRVGYGFCTLLDESDTTIVYHAWGVGSAELVFGKGLLMDNTQATYPVLLCAAYGAGANTVHVIEMEILQDTILGG